MGELVVGKPTFQLTSAASLPLDFVSVLSLLYRAVPGSGLHPELLEARRSLPRETVDDLDLLHGFSGRLLYYIEEPILAFGPYQSGRRDASFEDLDDYLASLEPEAFRLMAVRALERVHADLGTGKLVPELDDPVGWRDYVLPALTTASPDEALALLRDPDDLKDRTLRLMRGVWNLWYAGIYARNLPTAQAAATLAKSESNQGIGYAFTELTGLRLPATLVTALNDVELVSFVPSCYIGSFISFTINPPNLVIYFGAPEYLERKDQRTGNGLLPLPRPVILEGQGGPLASPELLESFRALGDQNRLRILDLLLEGELYAQEIVGRLGIAQSAVSRHLSLLERSGLVKVRPKGGMKYYAIDAERMDDLAAALCAHCKH